MSGAEILDDGRNLDAQLGDVSGIGADQRPAHAPDRPMPGAGRQVWQGPSVADTYYDQPVVKAPPWGPKVSAYLVAGGVAGTSAALASAVQMSGDPHSRLAGVAMGLAAASGSVGAGLLVADLGRPERFLHMVRVFRPTSVMNVGGYLLSTTTGASLASSLFAPRHGLLGTAGRLAGVIAGLTGLPLSGYTGVLLGATAIPGWNVGLTILPPLFVASGAATSGSLLRLTPLDRPSQRTVGAFAIAGQVGELAAGFVLERRMADRPRVQACYAATPGWRIGKWLTLGSLAVGLTAGRTTAGRLAAGVMGAVGSSLTKTAVFSAGMRSAADPLAVPESARPARP